MTDLDKLIEAVEVGDRGDKFWQAVHVIPPRHITNLTIARDGSLDAAKALKDALLPMWSAHIKIGADGNPSRAIVEPLTPMSGNPSSVTEWGGDPARALLLATLKAFRATQEAQP